MALQDNHSYLKLFASSGIADEKSLARAKELALESDGPKDLAVRMIREELLTSWQAKFLLTGRSRLKVGKYSLLERLDRAQFGDRFVAMHQQLDRKVELQLLKSELNQNSTALKRFLQQSQKAAELDHPNLVHVYDIDQESERYFLVVEHADGVSMDHDATVAQMKVSEVGMHLSQIIDGLAHAHESGVLHGKISRENLLLSHGGQLMLGNLAMATLVREVSSEHDELVRIGNTECDDWNAFGQTGLELLDLAEPDVGDKDRRRLKTILSGFVKLRDPFEDSLGKLKTAINEWVSAHFAFSSDLSSSSLSVMGVGDDLLEAAAESAANQTVKSKNVLEHAKQRQQAEAELEPEEPRKSPIALILGGVAAAIVFFMVAAGAVGYFVFFHDDGGRVADSGDQGFVDDREAAKPNRIFSSLPDSKIGEKNKNTNKKEDDKKTSVAENADKTGKTKQEDKKFDPFVVNNKSDEKKNTNKETKVSVPVSDKTGNTNPETGKNDSAKTENKNPKTVDKKGDTKKTETKKPEPKKTPPQLPPPFQAMPIAVGLPEIVEEGPQKEVMLGNVVCGPKHLLGLRLLMNESCAPRNVQFELERGTGADTQRWKVLIKRKTKSATIAEFWRENNLFKFKWLETAAKDRQAGYFQNCLIRMETRGEVEFLKLRQPVEIGNLAVDRKENENKQSFAMDYLPPKGVVYEVLRPSNAELQAIPRLSFLPINRKAESSNQPIFIFPSNLESARLYWVRIDVNVGKKLRIESRYQVAAGLGDKRGREFNIKSLERMRDEGNRMSQNVFTQLERLKAYTPTPEERTAHSRNVSEATKTLGKINSTNAEIQRILPLADKMYDLPIRFRVYFEIDGHTIDLATHDGKPFVLK